MSTHPELPNYNVSSIANWEATGWIAFGVLSLVSVLILVWTQRQRR